MTNLRFGLSLCAILSVGRVLAVYDDVTVEKYPDADAVVIDTDTKIEYAPDGSYVRISDDKIKVLTEKGRREESEISLHYNRRYGTAEIVEVKIIAEDGTERTVDVSATTKDSTDNSSTSANIYDPQDRRLVCTVPGLKVGEVLCYRTKNRNVRSRVKDQFADLALFELPAPLLHGQVDIISPAERPLKRWAVRNPLGNVSHEELKLDDGRILHSWCATNSPQAFPEPDMPPFYTQAQLLRVSTADDWPTLSRWYWDLSCPHLAKTTPAITNQVKAIGRDIEKIYKWVSQEIRYMGLTMEDTSPGYAPHDVNVTFDNRYGVCRDKAALLVAMLRIAGFEAYPVLIHAGAKMDPEVPMPYFNHAITCVRAPGDPRANKDGYILMDPTDESSRDLLPSYLSDRSYLVACPKGETLLTSQVPAADANSVKATDTATLEKDGTMLLESEIVFTGLNDNVYRGALLRRKNDERRKLFERIVRAVSPGAELLQFDLRPADLQDTAQQLKVKMYVKMPEMVLRGETRDELVVPMFTRALGAANWLLEGNTSLEKRRYPLDISSTACVDETLTLKLEGSLGQPLFLPEKVSQEGPHEFKRSFEVKDGVLTARRRLAINTVEVSAEEYLDLRESVKRVEAAERARPVFGKDKLQDANVHGLCQSERYVIKDAYSWCVTNTVQKQILTYDGKKKSSELKFSFNPTWKNVEVLSATVSNLNGSVSVLSEKEQNILDCGWASTAPRYPASKQLIVNLPSVEVGSVITYTTVTTVTNAPAPFYHTWFFDATDPVDLYQLSVEHPFGDCEAVSYEGPKTRIMSEPMQPEGILWRKSRTLSAGDFRMAARRLQPAVAVDAVSSSCLKELFASELKWKDPAETIRAIRDWMAKNIRLAGPGLYEVPLLQQVTDPSVILKERYATRLDYVRTLCALLKGAGFKADIVFAAYDVDRDPRLTQLDLVDRPDVGIFSSALCRVSVRTGGFLWMGGETKTYFLGTENEYTPIVATPYARCHYLDPKTGAVALVPEAPAFVPKTCRDYVIRLRENGSADVDVTEMTFGPAVGAFRKKYEELLPEDRSRHFQELLGELAQAATATCELETDTAGYPAVRRFSAFIPDYATLADGTMTLAVPAIGLLPFNLTGTTRETPLGIRSSESVLVNVKVTFPAGYAVIEHLPEAYAFADPTTADSPWHGFRVVATTEGEGPLACATVRLERVTTPHAATMVSRDYAALLKDWSRIASSRANRTISVRKSVPETK